MSECDLAPLSHYTISISNLFIATSNSLQICIMSIQIRTLSVQIHSQLSSYFVISNWHYVKSDSFKVTANWSIVSSNSFSHFKSVMSHFKFATDSYLCQLHITAILPIDHNRLKPDIHTLHSVN